jgi:hypothetical protein
VRVFYLTADTQFGGSSDDKSDMNKVIGSSGVGSFENKPTGGAGFFSEASTFDSQMDSEVEFPKLGFRPIKLRDKLLHEQA